MHLTHKIKNIFKAPFMALEHMASLNIAISRSAASFASRKPIESDVLTWEASGFSQNGEDGILDFLLARLLSPNKYFVEIGASDGIENNTSYLAHVKKYAGLHVEGSPHEHKKALLIKPWLLDCIQAFVSMDSVPQIISSMSHRDPDVFSIDIDGMDYHILKCFLQQGIKPGIVVVEYNSAFGPNRAMTIPYDSGFNMHQGPFPFLYYGVSLSAWKNLLSSFGYRFITVDSNGVNAFFLDSGRFEAAFLDSLKGIQFKENRHQLRKFKTDHRGQFEIMKGMDFVYMD